tara:strand:+ start:113 stop:1675 length:1563 start_codon:yes stop_codon:yes gene_type:complete
MAEIASPISGGIQAVRRTVSSSAFTGAAAPPAPAQPDPQTTSLLSQNSSALSSVSGQLASISQQVGQLNFSLSAIQSNLALQAQLDRQRAAAEQSREAQLAEQGLREGKESAVERRMQSALLKPVQSISQKAQFTLSRLSNAFMMIVGGWLGSKLVEFLKAKSEGNIDLMNQIRDGVIGGLLTLTGIFLGVKLAIGGLVRVLTSIAGNIFKVIGNNMIMRPIRALTGLFGKAATVAWNAIRVAAGGKIVNQTVKNVAPKATGGILKWLTGLFAMGGGGKKGGGVKPPKTSLTGGGGVTTATISAGLDILGGEDVKGSLITNIAGGGAWILVNKVSKAGPILKFLQSWFAFDAVKGVTGMLVGTPKADGGQANQDQGEVTGEQSLTEADKEQIIQDAGGPDNIMPSAFSPIDEEEEEKPKGFMRGLAGLADFATFGTTDFDKRGDLFKGKKKEVNVAQNISSLEDPTPNVIDMSTTSSQDSGSSSSGSSGTDMANTLPVIPSSNADNPTFLASKFYGVVAV